MRNKEITKYLLAIIDSQYKIDIDKSLNDPTIYKSIFDIAKRNGLYYVLTELLLSKNINLAKKETSRLIKEQDNFKKFKRTIEILNSASEEYGLNYILIKNCNTVPHVPRDVDIFIRFDEKKETIKILQNYGIICLHSGDIETTLQSNATLPLDLYTKIIYFGNEFLTEDFLFNSKREREIFNVSYFGLNNESEYMLTLLHSLFGHRYLTLLDLIHLNRLKRDDFNSFLCTNFADSMNWKDVFILADRKVDSIYRATFQENRDISFPYLFAVDFFMQCVNCIDGIDIRTKDRLLIEFSLILDGIGLTIKDSTFHNSIKRCTPLRNGLLSLGYLSRSMRGDKYS